MVSHEFKKKVQLASYLVHKFGNEGVSIIKVLKLIFLADVYALRKYGFSISDDTYYAMENGPVASEIDDIIEQSEAWVEGEEGLQYSKEFLRKESKKKNPWSTVYTNRNPDEEYLSDIDKECIDAVYEKFKEQSEEELIDITHKYKVWSDYEKDLGLKKRKEMNMDKVFANDGELAVEERVLKNAKLLYEQY